ncbi:hypothetical protein U9M48_005457, partial [Paspalum notatum var. saurae]
RYQFEFTVPVVLDAMAQRTSRALLTMGRVTTHKQQKLSPKLYCAYQEMQQIPEFQEAW